MIGYFQEVFGMFYSFLIFFDMVVRGIYYLVNCFIIDLLCVKFYKGCKDM